MSIYHIVISHLLAADDEKASAGKRRSAFKLLTELLLVGVYQDAAVVVNAVKALASVDFIRDKEAAQTAVSLLASFAKSGRQDVLGLSGFKLPALSVEDTDEVDCRLPGLKHCDKHIYCCSHITQHSCNVQAYSDSAAVIKAKQAYFAAKETYLEEAQRHFKLPAAHQQELQQMFITVFQAACRQLEQDHAALIEVDQENSRVLNNR